MAAYERTLEVTTDPGRREELANRIEQMEVWVETGTRPLGTGGGDPHEGHGH